MKYDMIMFDIDGTIWDVSYIILDALNDVLKKHDSIKRITHEKVTSGLGLNARDFSRHVFDFLDDDETKLQYLQEAEVIRNEYIEKNSIDPYPNFVEVVRKLSNRYKIAIVSNCGPGTIEHLISVLDINSSITDFCAASRFKISKAQAMERVKKDNNVMNVVYVGDTDLDRKSCEEAGIDFVYASYGFGKDVVYDHKIDALVELPDVIKKMEDEYV